MWLDWKQNFTIPMMYMQTGDQYWATARAEISCFGAVLPKHTAQQPNMLAKELGHVSSLVGLMLAYKYSKTYNII